MDLIDKPRARDLHRALALSYGALALCGCVLAAFPSGLTFGPSAVAIRWALVWALVGGGAGAWLCAWSRDRVRALRPLLLTAQCITFYFLWSAWPAPFEDRASRLLATPRDRVDPASFRVMAAELFAGSGPVDDQTRAVLALAAYRAQRLNEPATGLTLSAAAAAGFLSFASPADVESRAAVLFKRALPAEDAATFAAWFTAALWSDLRRPLLDVGAGVDAVPTSAGDLSSNGGLDGVAKLLVGADKMRAREMLGVLARARETWPDPRLHALAARALLVLESAPEAGLEREISSVLAQSGAARDATLDADLGRLAQVISARARSTEQLGDIRAAMRVMQEAIRTDPAALAATDVVWRENVGSQLDEELAALRKLLGHHRSRLELLVAGDRETQLQPWIANRRLLSIAHTYRALGRTADALRAMSLVDDRLADPFLSYRVRVLATAWNDR